VKFILSIVEISDSSLVLHKKNESNAKAQCGKAPQANVISCRTDSAASGRSRPLSGVSRRSEMRLVSLILLLSGWLIVLTAIVLLAPAPSRAVFVFAGLGVQALGLGLLLRSHLAPRGEKG